MKMRIIRPRTRYSVVLVIISKQQLTMGFRLGDWTVRPADGSISSPAATTRLEPLTMDLLVFLCSRTGEVVTKDETLAAVWHGRLVSEETLKSSFYHLRKALGDSPREPRYIETIPKRGYRVLLEPIPLASSTRGTRADDLYLKGKAFSAQPGATDLKQALLYLERAVELDPQHAEAATALAHMYIRCTALGLGGGHDLLSHAQSLAGHAGEISPMLASAHLATAITRLLLDHDVAMAESSLKKAIDLDPDDAQAHAWYARFCYFVGRREDAVNEARRAVALDPLSLGVRRDYIETLLTIRRFDEAIAEARSLIRTSPPAADVQLGLSWVYYLAGDEQEAFACAFSGFKNLGVASKLLDRTAASFREGGMVAVFRLWAKLMQEQADVGNKTLDLLILHSLLGDTDEAFALIDRLVKQSHPAMLSLPGSPIFDKLRQDARFRAVLRDMRI
jgi:DNA-binding winged helix-turn-helix (wHTH) protein/Tfp pilus assembly protein PilF